jgi:hypothetical protein
MPLSINSPAPYAPASAIIALLDRNRRSGLPAVIDKDTLARLGVSDSLAPRTLQALCTLDLIEENGGHTDVLKKLRVAPEAEYQEKLAEWLNSAYAEILQYADPAVGDETSVRDAFRPYSPTSMQDRMLTLFTGLYGAAGIWPDSAQRARVTKNLRLKPRAASKQVVSPPPLQPKGEQAKEAQVHVHGKANGEEKALEYRLVDLMAEAASTPEVLSAIISVITFLKTKDLKSHVGTSGGQQEGG